MLVIIALPPLKELKRLENEVMVIQLLNSLQPDFYAVPESNTCTNYRNSLWPRYQ